MKIHDLTGRIAAVTGGGSGIGAAIVRRFSAAGARVEILDVDDVGSRTLAQETGAGWHCCDVSEESEVATVFQRISAAHGRLDILVNNAGIAHIGTATTTGADDFDRIYRVNVKGVRNCLAAALPHLVAAGGGAIVNLASIAGQIGIADRFAYSMSKGAVLAMTYSVAKDFLAQKIRCNAICPARIHTPFVDGFLAKNYPGREEEMFAKLAAYQPVGRMGTPDEVAALVLYLASDESAFLTGCALPLDGGVLNLR